METIVYRNTNDTTRGTYKKGEPVSSEENRVFSPELFYPSVTDQEMLIWTHWLPSSVVYYRDHILVTAEVTLMLRQLKAPAEVLEEFHWACKMDLFESYEIRTPVRRDARDPLLLGRVDGKVYRVALWGESLLPLEEITALVQKSLALKARTARWQAWLPAMGALLGLVAALGLGHLGEDGNAAAMIFTLTFLGLFSGWLPRFLYTPENRQHDFLDRYRC